MKPHSSYVQKKLVHQVVQYIVSHVQPIYLVKIDNFKLLIKSFDSQFKMACVSTIKMIIFDSYTSAIKQIIDLILGTSDTVSLTFDIWSSQAYNSYIRITCHWLTEPFESHEIILEIGIFSITTDNSVNVKSAVQQIGITNVKSLVSILSKEKKRKQLHEAQLQINPGLKELLDVIKDVDTRWNSTFHSIELLVYLRPAIMQLYSTLNNHALREIRKKAEMMSSFLPSEEEFELLEELIAIFSPFDEATQFLSRSKYLILGFMIPMLEELARWLKYLTGHNEEAIFVKDTILDNLIE
ncbi:16905_t:CDS:2 [Gigaspora margarita]|uniref:16905_t:CDS:1 n=1 Tax=Gigaspora margarita TaxID=4874 RepID=A0ABN7W159_GIGMA|nr:16905_t:CDS:2 [Gigaspora margarita]